MPLPGQQSRGHSRGASPVGSVRSHVLSDQEGLMHAHPLQAPAAPLHHPADLQQQLLQQQQQLLLQNPLSAGVDLHSPPVLKHVPTVSSAPPGPTGGRGKVRNRRNVGRANFGTTKMCQIMPRYWKVCSLLSGRHAWLSWRAHCRCVPQPPGNKSSHPEASNNEQQPTKGP